MEAAFPADDEEGHSKFLEAKRITHDPTQPINCPDNIDPEKLRYHYKQCMVLRTRFKKYQSESKEYTIVVNVRAHSYLYEIFVEHDKHLRQEQAAAEINTNKVLYFVVGLVVCFLLNLSYYIFYVIPKHKEELVKAAAADAVRLQEILCLNKAPTWPPPQDESVPTFCRSFTSGPVNKSSSRPNTKLTKIDSIL